MHVVELMIDPFDPEDRQFPIGYYPTMPLDQVIEQAKAGYAEARKAGYAADYSEIMVVSVPTDTIRSFADDAEPMGKVEWRYSEQHGEM